jgi:hypothetical protein
MEIVVKMAEKSSEGRGRRRRGGLPHRQHHGERRPLAPFLHGLMGALPHGDGIHRGRRKRGSGGYKFMGGGVSHELGFLSLYSFSNFRLPILGRTRLGLTQSSGIRIRANFMSRTFAMKFPTTL